MGRVRGFILSHFTRSYLLIFLPFLSIMSIVYIIRVASFTEKFSLEGWEIVRLFGFFAPDILFYTIPLSFIAALSVTLAKLSESNELIAIFSFGFTPWSILGTLLPLTISISVFMLLLSIYEIPRGNLEYRVFIGDKIAESKISIMPNQLGQKFGQYIIYTEGKVKDEYQNITLFATNSGDKRVIFMADRASIENRDDSFVLNLHNGTGDTFLSDTIESVEYERMSLFSYPKSSVNIERLQRGWSEIWSNHRDMARLIYDIFISISPLLVFLSIAAFSIINPRYQKSYTYIVASIATISIYSIASFLMKSGTPQHLLGVLIIFLTVGVVLFRKNITSNF